MRHLARAPLTLAACALLGIGVTTTQAAENQKVQICHATASDTNPYVLITVDEHALAGHFREKGTTAPGHGQNNFPDLLVTDDMPLCPGSGGEGGGEG